MAKKKASKKSQQRPAKRSAKAATIKAAPKPVKKAAAKKPAAKGAAKKPGLPRPTISGEEKLFLLFKDDYHARQIFDFLRVETVHELEQFAADDIVKRLSRPIVESVDRIRRRLAEKNRYLPGDQDYLISVIKEAPR